MITIKSMKVSSPFAYLWMKRVIGVDLSVHCARCLKGSYIKPINTKVQTLENFILPNGIYYLCGVARPFNWNNNFHLAFEYKQGETLAYSNNGITVFIANAVRLPISENNIDVTDSNYRKKEYFTCRNWQFAHWLFKNRKCL